MYLKTQFKKDACSHVCFARTRWPTDRSHWSITSRMLACWRAATPSACALRVCEHNICMCGCVSEGGHWLELFLLCHMTDAACSQQKRQCPHLLGCSMWAITCLFVSGSKSNIWYKVNLANLHVNLLLMIRYECFIWHSALTKILELGIYWRALYHSSVFCRTCAH